MKITTKNEITKFLVQHKLLDAGVPMTKKEFKDSVEKTCNIIWPINKQIIDEKIKIIATVE